MATALQRFELASRISPLATKVATPQILRINRYALRPETETAVRNLQKQVAHVLVRWDYPHPCLAIEALTGPKEVWCISGFQSSMDQKNVAEKLEGNEGLRSALDRVEAQVRVLTGSPSTVSATYRQSTPRRRAWRMGRGHFLVISTSSTAGELDGACYETSTGLRYFLTAARTRRDADARAALAGPTANVFAIRPTWGMPSWDWIYADPEFWNASPVVKQGRPAVTDYRVVCSFGVDR